MQRTSANVACRLTGLVLAAFIGSVAAAGPGRDVLSNPGFEKDTNRDGWPDDWVRDVGGGQKHPQGTFGRDATVKESGAFSASIRKRPGEDLIARWFRYVPVEAEQLYELSVSYRAEKGFTGTADIMVNRCGLNEVTRRLPAPSTHWQRARLPFTPKQSGKLAVYLQNRGTGTVWFDNASLVAVPPQEMVNLIANGDFEKAREDGFPSDKWWVYKGLPAPEVARVSVDSSVRHSGNSSLKIEVKSKRFINLVSGTARVNPGDRIHMSLAYKSNLRRVQLTAEERAKDARKAHRRKVAPCVQFYYGYRNAQGRGLENDGEIIGGKEATDGWERIEKTYVAPKSAASVQMQLVVNDAVGEMWWDDVVVRKLNRYSLDMKPYRQRAFPGRDTLALTLENYAGAKDNLTLDLSIGGKVVGSKSFTASGRKKEAVKVDYASDTPGRHTLTVALTEAKTRASLFSAQKELDVPQVLETNLVQPTYVWPDKQVTALSERLRVNLRPRELAGASVRIRVLRDGREIRKAVLTPERPEVTWETPVAGLGTGRHVVEIVLTDEAGKVRATREEAFHVMDRARPSVAVRDKTITIDGKPIFPIGMYSPRPSVYEDYASAGFNFVHNYRLEGDWQGNRIISDREAIKVFDRAMKCGLWTMISTPRITLVKGDFEGPGGLRARFEALNDHPSAIFYEQEEHLIRGQSSYEKLKKWHDLIREIDPDRLIVMGDVKVVDGKKVFYDELQDIGVYWWYPWPLAKGQTEVVIPEWLTENVKNSRSMVWVAPQSYKGEAEDKRFPLAEEYRVQTYLSVIHGARGLMYFGGHIFKDPVEGRWEDLKKVVREISELSPVLLSATSGLRLEVRGSEKISTMLKQHEGAYWLLAANRDVPEAAVTFRLPFRPGRVKVWKENRTIAPEGRSFRDTFAKYGIHVYEITK